MSSIPWTPCTDVVAVTANGQFFTNCSAELSTVTPSLNACAAFPTPDTDFYDADSRLLLIDVFLRPLYLQRLFFAPGTARRAGPSSLRIATLRGQKGENRCTCCPGPMQVPPASPCAAGTASRPANPCCTSSTAMASAPARTNRCSSAWPKSSTSGCAICRATAKATTAAASTAGTVTRKWRWRPSRPVAGSSARCRAWPVDTASAGC
ncbi:hypothetical protein D3C76_683650 [compost metagenome]